VNNMEYYCSECGKPCEKKWYDASLGTVDCRGSRVSHRDGCWVSDCCEGELIDESEVYDCPIHGVYVGDCPEC
jgi:DNA-directed RNA polymerase subunit RPC12/RpoP